jgi:hypothetical protein
MLSDYAVTVFPDYSNRPWVIYFRLTQFVQLYFPSKTRPFDGLLIKLLSQTFRCGFLLSSWDVYATGVQFPCYRLHVTVFCIRAKLALKSLSGEEEKKSIVFHFYQSFRGFETSDRVEPRNIFWAVLIESFFAVGRLEVKNIRDLNRAHW